MNTRYTRWLILLFFILCPALLHAQYQPIQGWCEDGGELVVTSGLNSTNPVQASHPSCTVTVIIHGGGAASIYSTPTGTALANPFTADSNGQWIFYALPAASYDVTLTGGTPALPAPVVYYTDIQPGGGGGANLLTSNNVWTGTNRWNNTSAFHGTTDFCGPKPWRDVTCYGAIGDGMTDDSAAIQAAVNAACANTTTGGGEVRFPPPAVNYYVASTIHIETVVAGVNTCTMAHLLGTQGPQGGGFDQFARAPRVKIQGPAVPIFDFDNCLNPPNSSPTGCTVGANSYFTLENLDIYSLGGQAVHTRDLSLSLYKNVGFIACYDSMLTYSAALVMEGSSLWTKFVDSSFTMNNTNCTAWAGPFNPTPPKTYDPSSWAKASVWIVGNSNSSGSILFDFENPTFSFGGVKMSEEDTASGSCGLTYGEMIFSMAVIEGTWASPLLQFENNKTGAACGATLSRITSIESQASDIAHPTPMFTARGIDGSHTASFGSLYLVHNLGHSNCFIQGLNGHENIAGIISDSPQNVAYACDQFSVPGVSMDLIRHTNGGYDFIAPPGGPTKYSITDADGGSIRTFVPDGTNADDLTATSMLDSDGAHYLGPGGTLPFDLLTHRVTSSTYGVAIPVPTPTGFTAMATTGGSLAPGTYFLRLAAGDRNFTPFTTSAASAEISVLLSGANNAISLTWTTVPTNPGNKYTYYIGTSAGNENKAQNVTSVAGPVLVTTIPNPNQVPSEAGNLLADTFQILGSGFKDNFGTAYQGFFTGAPTVNRTWTFPDASMNVVGDTTIQTLTNKTLLDTTTTFANTSAPTKTAKFDLSGATAGFAATLAFTHTAARTYTLPNASLTFVGLDTAQTLTNKTLLDTTTIFGNAATPSKALKFDLASATAAKTAIVAFAQTADRTYTFPDRSGTVCVTGGACATQSYDCGTMAACSPTQFTSTIIMIGDAALNGASPALVTITGMSPAFASSSSYHCTVSDSTATMVTDPQISYVSGSSFTIASGTNGLTDTMHYICIGQ